MSDSLRDQLLKAGFKQPATDKSGSGKSKHSSARKSGKSTGPKSGKPNQRHNSAQGNNQRSATSKQGLQSEATPEEILEKKALKEKIKTLIETNCIKDYAGTASYGFLVSNRVRQLFVKEEYRKLLSEGSLVITRLNGNTHLVTPEIAKEILSVNPQWAVFSNSDNKSSSVDSNDEYSEYQVPDDLIW